MTRKGIVVNTTSVIGYTTLSTLARLRPIRPRSLRFGREQDYIDAWLARVVEEARTNYDLACETTAMARVLKGYGQTHEHGRESFETLTRAALTLRGQDAAPETLRSLVSAALGDETGDKLRGALVAKGIV